MLTMLGSARRCCDGLTRRDTLRAGALGLLGGLSLADLLRAEEAGHAGRGKARSVILLYLLGGAPTQDMYDLKPDAPAGVRSDFKPIATRVPGVQVCEHLPRLASWAHRVALVRSLTHQSGCHNPLPSYTGHEALLPDIVSTRDTYPPSMGSVCEYLNDRPGGLPAYVYMPCYLGWGQAIRRPGPYGGFLGQRCDPLFTECLPHLDPGTPAESPGHPQVCRGVPRLPDGALGGVTLDRLDARRGLLRQFDDERRRLDAGRAPEQFDRARGRAFDLLTSRKVRDAFAIDREDPHRIDRYGRTLFGNGCLIARKLVEAGVRFVNVTWDIYWDRYRLQYDGWDTHTRNFPILKEYNLPYFDLAFGALLDDLEERGLLGSTLVLVLSEMGRTPRLNGNGGRDHWTHCYGALFAGAGVRGGSVCGASDSQAAYVKDRPVSPGDVCATVYHCLGIDPDMTVPDRAGRPVPVAHGGAPIREVL
jgi:hypothetical protein